MQWRRERRLESGSRYGGDIFKEISQAIAGFEVIEERLKRDTRSSEHGCAAHDFGVP